MDIVNADALASAGLMLPLRVGFDGEILDNVGSCLIVVDPNRELADDAVAIIGAAVTSSLNQTAGASPEVRLFAARVRDDDAKPEGTFSSLRLCAAMLETHGPECFPANEDGKISFARLMIDVTASEIRAFLSREEARSEEIQYGHEGPR
ncbi:hypothetical protein [Sphingomonas sp. UMB7805-LC452B]|nr:hypothetical protein [Sphingomonas sp. UMB7805-LC452B]MDK8216361.1 hypothetical protein [Sphingomonas sp. UMB7805-LC452B]